MNLQPELSVNSGVRQLSINRCLEQKHRMYLVLESMDYAIPFVVYLTLGAIMYLKFSKF